jgi:hypothetical protein
MVEKYTLTIQLFGQEGRDGPITQLYPCSGAGWP